MSFPRLTERLGHVFTDAGLLREALTHRSFGGDNNERLEFLGDAVLNGIISEQLYRRFPELDEGELSRQRASLVRQEALCEVARNLDLGEFLRLGEGERRSGGQQRASILADALEAILGAVYLDGGHGAAAAVISHLFAEPLARLDPRQSGKDAKTLLQELLQARRLALPRYALVAVRGVAHQQEFEAECQVPALSLRTTGAGRSRRAAEQTAAQRMLAAIEEKDQ